MFALLDGIIIYSISRVIIFLRCEKFSKKCFGF